MAATASIKKVFRSIHVVLEVFVKVFSKPTPDQEIGVQLIRKSDFRIEIILSVTSGSIRKSTSGSKRKYPKKSGVSALLHHSHTYHTDKKSSNPQILKCRRTQDPQNEGSESEVSF
jgi:hypothetical protein